MRTKWLAAFGQGYIALQVNLLQVSAAYAHLFAIVEIAYLVGIKSHQGCGDDVDRQGIETVADAALARASDGTDGVYLSLDIDVVDPVHCPAQKYPEPLGLTSRQIITALRRIGQRANVVGFDLCCLGPQYDDRVGTGSHLAARLFVEIMAAMAWRRSGSTAPPAP